VSPEEMRNLLPIHFCFEFAKVLKDMRLPP
jgi:hypothetical protein